MKRKILTLLLILGSTSTFSMNYPKRLLVAALAASSVINGAMTQCDKACDYEEEFAAFGDYLEDLTNCEKADLLPIMEERFEFISAANSEFKKLSVEDFEASDSRRRLGDVNALYKHEVRLFKAELKKTQELLFDDCTTDESKAILAKHASILIDSIDAHTKYIEFFETLGK